VVNDTTEKTTPKGAIDQIGESLLHIIHAFSEANEDVKFFMVIGILKMDLGEWIVRTGRNGILHMSYLRKRVNWSK
jgi:hypothetical protein